MKIGKKEKNIPIPPRRNGCPTTKYQVRDLKIGESRLFAEMTDEEERNLKTTLVRYCRKYGETYTCRRITRGNIRIWRIV